MWTRVRCERVVYVQALIVILWRLYADSADARDLGHQFDLWQCVGHAVGSAVLIGLSCLVALALSRDPKEVGPPPRRNPGDH